MRIVKTGTSQAPELPVTLHEFKQHARITVDDQDLILSSYLASATENIEEQTNRAISVQAYLISFDRFPACRELRLPLGRIQSVTSVTYLDSAGAEQTWASGNYATDLNSDFSARLWPVPSSNWPSIGAYPGAIRIAVVAGFTPAQLKYSLKQAVLMKASAFDMTRAPGDDDPDAIDQAIHNLISPWVLPVW